MDSFFKVCHVRMALSNSNKELKKQYKKSERELLDAARSGDEQLLAKAMKQHGAIEYAMLFQKTPKFKNRGK